MAKRWTQKFLDFSALAASLCAVGLTALAFQRGLLRTSAPVREPIVLESNVWRDLSSVGHRVGSETPSLTILQFGDYECPPCREFHSTITGFVEEHAEEIAFVYRHWPLEYHKDAYHAARAAECAGEQERFWDYHDRLLTTDQWAGDAFRNLARKAGVPDMGSFLECLNDGAPVPRIEEDLEDIRRIDATGTPTVIVNGTILPTPPTLGELETMLDQATREEQDAERVIDSP